MFNYPYYYYNKRRPFPIMRENSNNESQQNFSENKEINNRESNNNHNNNKPNNQEFIFELFGLKLYTDDILILSLLFLLYSENVKDDFLFIILLLLLLS